MPVQPTAISAGSRAKRAKPIKNSQPPAMPARAADWGRQFLKLLGVPFSAPLQAPPRRGSCQAPAAVGLSAQRYFGVPVAQVRSISHLHLLLLLLVTPD